MALFNRTKSCSVELLNETLLEVKGLFIDSFHEINLTLHVSISNLEIVWAKAEMVRTPHPACMEAAVEGEKLIGIKIGPGSRKAIQEAVGHSHGCTHIADLALDTAKAAIQANFKLQRSDMTREQRHEMFVEKLAGTCHFWTIAAEKLENNS
ncbi:MAG TPA: DUF2889 domain-containing protein [Desulfobacteria bacterium]|nr:DUF2889 domain-containing protein [Desulfobacteria bacterium]